MQEINDRDPQILEDFKRQIVAQADDMMVQLDYFLKNIEQDNIVLALKECTTLIHDTVPALVLNDIYTGSLILQSLWRCSRFLSSIVNAYEYEPLSRLSRLAPALLNMGLLGIIAQKLSSSSHEGYHEHGLQCLMFSLLATASLPDASCKALVPEILQADAKTLLPRLLNLIGVASGMTTSIVTFLENTARALDQNNKAEVQDATSLIKKELQFLEEQHSSTKVSKHDKKTKSTR